MKKQQTKFPFWFWLGAIAVSMYIGVVIGEIILKVIKAAQ